MVASRADPGSRQHRQAPPGAGRGCEHTDWRLEPRDEHGNVTTLPHDSFVPMQVDAMVKVQSPPPGWILPNLASEMPLWSRAPCGASRWTTSCATCLG